MGSSKSVYVGADRGHVSMRCPFGTMCLTPEEAASLAADLLEAAAAAKGDAIIEAGRAPRTSRFRKAPDSARRA